MNRSPWTVTVRPERLPRLEAWYWTATDGKGGTLADGNAPTRAEAQAAAEATIDRALVQATADYEAIMAQPEPEARDAIEVTIDRALAQAMADYEAILAQPALEARIKHLEQCLEALKMAEHYITNGRLDRDLSPCESSLLWNIRAALSRSTPEVAP